MGVVLLYFEPGHSLSITEIHTHIFRTLTHSIPRRILFLGGIKTITSGERGVSFVSQSKAESKYHIKFLQRPTAKNVIGGQRYNDIALEDFMVHELSKTHIGVFNSP